MKPEFELLDGEVFTEVLSKGYSKYYISNYGRLFDKSYPDICINALRKEQCTLNKDTGTSNKISVLRIMYIAFIGKVPNKKVPRLNGVLHLDNIVLCDKKKRPNRNRDIRLYEDEYTMPIPNFTSYKISNYGRVFRINKKGNAIHILKPNERSENVDLCDGSGVKYSVHIKTLMMKLFGGHSITNKECIINIDGNKNNNHINNLAVINKTEIDKSYRIPSRNKSKYYIDKKMQQDFIDGKLNVGTLKCLQIAPYIYECSKCGNKLFPKIRIKTCKYCKEEERIKRAEYNKKIYIIKHKIWGAIQRCENPKLKDLYKYYGAKGIRVIKYWKSINNFVNWCLDICNGDIDSVIPLTIDRIDPRYEYAPYNCQLITREQNSRKMIYDKNRTPFELYIDKIIFKRRKRNWIKQMVKQGYKEEDLI